MLFWMLSQKTSEAVSAPPCTGGTGIPLRASDPATCISPRWASLGSLGTTCFQGFPWVPLHLSQAGLHLGQRYQRAFLPSIWIIPPNTCAKRCGHHCSNLKTASPPGEVKGPVFYLRSCSQEDGWAPPLKVLEPPLWPKPGWVKGVISRTGQQGCSWPLSRNRKSPEGPNTDDTGAHRKERKRKKRLENSGPNTPTLPGPASVTFNPSTCYTLHLVSFLIDAIALFSPQWLWRGGRALELAGEKVCGACFPLAFPPWAAKATSSVRHHKTGIPTWTHTTVHSPSRWGQAEILF